MKIPSLPASAPGSQVALVFHAGQFPVALENLRFCRGIDLNVRFSPGARRVRFDWGLLVFLCDWYVSSMAPAPTAILVTNLSAALRHPARSSKW